MSASTSSEKAAQRAQLVNKVETAVTHKAQLGNQGLILHFRVVLRDLPFAGQPSLLLDAHRRAIEKLVERAKSQDIKIFSIIGHTSEPGSDAFNEGLSLDRAEAVFNYLRDTVDTDSDYPDDSFYSSINTRGLGETQPISPMADEGDNPLNRRVEISYRIKIVFPQPPGGIVPRSRYWKIDFSAGGGVGIPDSGNILPESLAVGVEGGFGSLTMLPDDETGQSETIHRPLSYWALGISVGLLSVFKKLKFVTRFPKLKRLLAALDAGMPGAANYTRTAEFLENAGFSVDLLSEGGAFFTDEPLSFAEMAHFNFSMITGNISLGASGSGSLVMLHSGYFFASTVIYGAGLNIASPDLGVNFVPAAWVQVDV